MNRATVLLVLALLLAVGVGGGILLAAREDYGSTTRTCFGFASGTGDDLRAASDAAEAACDDPDQEPYGG